MEFFLECEPPTVTAQEHKVMVRHGRPMFYDTQRIKDARAMYCTMLKEYAPPVPMVGAIRLHVDWYFRTNDRKRNEQPKTTKPDTDNLQKLLKDCMTRVGYWNDDAQVTRENVSKRWTMTTPGILIRVEEDK